MSRRLGSYLAAVMMVLGGGCGEDSPPTPELDGGLDAEVLDARVVPDATAPDAPGCADDDGDGHAAATCGGDDCDDADASRYPGATEVCDADDEDCTDTTYGADADGDGFESALCCNGAGNCGADCDDALNTVNPSAAEQCNGGVDDDCDGAADAEDGVCVPCPVGYAGLDGACVNLDECATDTPCGGAVGATCTDTDGSYVCTCPVGYEALATGGTCSDVDECVAGTPCGSNATACVNLAGTYSCACAVGYVAPATGAACVDLDECTTATTCGGGRAGCANVAGTYVCACQSGYAAPATGGTCVDIDECASGTPCGSTATSCTNTLGAYICRCAPGYGAPASGGTCADVDECSAGACGLGAIDCVNSVGSYACTCAPGYTAPASGAPCADIDECVLGAPCGAGSMACANVGGSYACTCVAGYTAPTTGGTCTDLNECALGTHDCDSLPLASCGNSVGSFSCACPTDFGGDGHGAGGCLLSNPSLASLVPSAGVLSPAFASETILYTLALPPGITSVTFRPSVGFPTRATITVDGVSVASGASSLTVTLPPARFPALPVTLTVTTESGATRTYTVVVDRGSRYAKASNTNGNDLFGYGQVLSADGLTLAVGAYGEDSNATGVGGDELNNAASNAGAVYVFARSGAGWSQQAYLKASNADTGDWFGRTVALSADGSTLAVGAMGEDSNAAGVGGDETNNGAVDAGAAYVFTRVGTTWSQHAYVKASNASPGDAFGGAVALSADGLTLGVGAYLEDSSATGVGGAEADDAASAAGAVYVFGRVGATWSQQAYLKASNTDASDEFGWALALSGDGSTLAVGAPEESSNATGMGGDQANNTAAQSGAVYVFTRAGTSWTQQAYVKASNTDQSDFFGYALTLSGDGSTLAVGAYREASSATGVGGEQADDRMNAAGAAYVFTRGGGTWAQQAYIKASNTALGDSFAQALALSADGLTLAVGAPGEASSATGLDGDQADNGASNAGAVYLFSRVGVAWTQRAYVKASNAGTWDWFGRAVSLSADGSMLAVSAPYEGSIATGTGGDQTSNAAPYAGAVYVY